MKLDLDREKLFCDGKSGLMLPVDDFKMYMEFSRSYVHIMYLKMPPILLNKEKTIL